MEENSSLSVDCISKVPHSTTWGLGFGAGQTRSIWLLFPGVDGRGICQQKLVDWECLCILIRELRRTLKSLTVGRVVAVNLFCQKDGYSAIESEFWPQFIIPTACNTFIKSLKEKKKEKEREREKK